MSLTEPDNLQVVTPEETLRFSEIGMVPAPRGLPCTPGAPVWPEDIAKMKKEEENRRMAEEDRKAKEEARRKAEEEARRKAEEDRRQAEKEEAQRRQAEREAIRLLQAEGLARQDVARQGWRGYVIPNTPPLPGDVPPAPPF